MTWYRLGTMCRHRCSISGVAGSMLGTITVMQRRAQALQRRPFLLPGLSQTGSRPLKQRAPLGGKLLFQLPAPADALSGAGQHKQAHPCPGQTQQMKHSQHADAPGHQPGNSPASRQRQQTVCGAHCLRTRAHQPAFGPGAHRPGPCCGQKRRCQRCCKAYLTRRLFQRTNQHGHCAGRNHNRSAQDQPRFSIHENAPFVFFVIIAEKPPAANAAGGMFFIRGKITRQCPRTGSTSSRTESASCR